MNNTKRIIDEYFQAISAKNKAIAFLIERVRMLSAQRDDLTREVIELRAKIRAMEAEHDKNTAIN